MAIAPYPSLPHAPALTDLELVFRELQGFRDDLAGLLTDPFYEPLRAGIDGQLARVYRAIQAAPQPRLAGYMVGDRGVANGGNGHAAVPETEAEARAAWGDR